MNLRPSLRVAGSRRDASRASRRGRKSMSSRMNRKSFLRKAFVGRANTGNDEGLASGSVHDLRGGRAGEVGMTRRDSASPWFRLSTSGVLTGESRLSDRARAVTSDLGGASDGQEDSIQSVVCRCTCDGLRAELDDLRAGRKQGTLARGPRRRNVNRQGRHWRAPDQARDNEIRLLLRRG